MRPSGDVSQPSARPGMDRPVFGSSRVNPQTNPERCAFRPGGNDGRIERFGSPPLMIVTSAGGSWRTQPESKMTPQSKKIRPSQTKMRPRKIRRRVWKWPSRYFDCVGAAGALVGADRGNDSKPFAGTAAGWETAVSPAGARKSALHLFLLQLLFKFQHAALVVNPVLQIAENQRQPKKLWSSIS